ncbi:autotransporter-associated beta strand repeat-containing protein, partial [Sphingosinicella sp. CPCC 101087]|uniref:autotransporter-associated beta strand repeat-containing protein n=1 Tax=Sphingosinicella sp. CPCC 101087 TaxID=2497754 RepID=UPI00197F7845
TLTGSAALIQVGDGSAAGAGYTATIANALVGSATLVKSDLGTLILSGTNSYGGGTRINGGVLQIERDENLGLGGALALDGGMLRTTGSFATDRAIALGSGGGTFETAANSRLVANGQMTGGGALVKAGAGTLVLAEAASHSGGTTIAAGILQIGNGGTTGSLVGDVTNAGSLAFARADTYVFAGRIAGAGSVSQAGGGTTVFTADHSYTGGTTIAGGTLQIGNGGAGGSIVGDVANDGRLAFNRSNEYVFAGLISGSGSVDQAGAGTTILTGDNSYKGETIVSAGTLLIEGDQSAVTGLTLVRAGTLGGTGTIGGDVSILDGAVLAPGSDGPGTLTINGDLSFAGSARLGVEFGEANVVGGPLNDLVSVGGDLVLDGTVDIAVSAGGSFDIGVYRLIDYAGALTDNGLEVGSQPDGGDAFVQTSVEGRVNLVNTGGATLNFWDGAAGPKLDGTVNGGDGIWQGGAGNDNWADASGTVNAGYSNGAFAIFSAAPGTVTIDDSLGAVAASGLQFASDGYVITGDALTLSAAQSVIRVGDGTAQGAGYSATIEAELTGAARLVKTDLGTLVLTGANSYSGGTRIEAGIVRISSDANLGA